MAQTKKNWKVKVTFPDDGERKEREYVIWQHAKNRADAERDVHKYLMQKMGPFPLIQAGGRVTEEEAGQAFAEYIHERHREGE